MGRVVEIGVALAGRDEEDGFSGSHEGTLYKKTVDIVEYRSFEEETACQNL